MTDIEPCSVDGMGAVPHGDGTSFRVWAPHAEKVCVTGTFNNWSETGTPLAKEAEGYWPRDVPEANVGDRYRFVICAGENRLSRIDPYARKVTHSAGNAIIDEPNFDWKDDDFRLPRLNELIIYELHMGTFNDQPGGPPGNLNKAIEKLPYLKDLGINAIEIMPAMEFRGSFSWGYNPALIYAIESGYGGPLAFKQFVQAAHSHGIAVILDVVYNHFGPADLSLWQFDGWSENNNFNLLKCVFSSNSSRTACVNHTDLKYHGSRHRLFLM